MRLLSGADKAMEQSDSGAAIRLGEVSRRCGAETSSRLSWGLLLTVFMRLMAVLWVSQGLLQWSLVLLPRAPLFDAVTPTWGAAVIFFAVLDLVAAVGLWLATPWGGAIWLFGAIAQMVVALAISGFFSPIWIAVDGVLIVLYFALVWRAGQAGVRRGAAKPR
jgi:uncharacterized membrane protein (DUF2068 family)